MLSSPSPVVVKIRNQQAIAQVATSKLDVGKLTKLRCTHREKTNKGKLLKLLLRAHHPEKDVALNK